MQAVGLLILPIWCPKFFALISFIPPGIVSTESIVTDDSLVVNKKMKNKSADGKPVKTRPVGYRVSEILLNEFAQICERDGLDHQAQIRMMLEKWIEERRTT